MKKILYLFPILILCGFFFLFPNSSHAENNNSSADLPLFSENLDLTPEQIEERFNLINSTYKIGEPFNKSDTDFIKNYAQISVEPTIQGRSIKWVPLGGTVNKSFNKTKTSQGVNVNFSGKVYYTSGLLTNSYKGNIKASIASGSSKVKSMKLVTTHSAYGVVGSGGTYVGLVHDSSLSTSLTGKSIAMDKTKKYSAALVVHTYTNAYVTVNTTSGSFNLYAF
ncbi:hypothetical protein ACFVRR_05935 [Gottfriedia sp. NPDC057948]|uniref:hypothetical protein n=1 Tax=Gottfriedia sp. NPDC057948 TaxID=3346287 RepID=UPI0036DA1FB6